MTFEPQISSFKHKNESWAEFSLLSSSMNLPFLHLNIFSETQAVLAEQKEGTFHFQEESKQKWAMEAGQNVLTDLTIFTDLFSLSLVFLLQPSLFVLNFHWDQQKVSYHTPCYLQTASLECLNIFP